MSRRAWPKVSIVMPVCRTHHRLCQEAIRSIVGQSLREWELLVIEDAIGCSGVLCLPQSSDCRVRFCRCLPGTTQAEKRNWGLAEARAELVANLDADDVAAPTRLEKQLRFMECHPEIDVLGSAVHAIDQNGRHLGYRLFPERHEAILEAMRFEVPLNHPSVVFRRSCVQSVGGYTSTDFAVAEDYDLWSRMAQAGARFANLPEPLTHYRIHPNQLKARRTRDVLRAVLAVKRKYWYNSMNCRARVRMIVERALLWMPEWLVFGMMVHMYYRRLSPAFDCTGNELGPTLTALRPHLQI
jgi:glycosyltransferase involved in cell wall biosynthesis